MQTRCMISLGLAAVAGLSACGSDDAGPRTEKPSAPAANDPSYTVSGVEPWYVMNNDATTLDQMMTITVTAPGGTDTVDAYVADLPVQRMTELPDGRFGLQLSVADVPAGAQQVLLSANNDTTAFAALPFNRSQPYYVLVTTDWDFSDPGANAITYQDELHQYHPEIRITHFVGPYTFTDPAVTSARQQELVTWLLAQKANHDDEIGLHIHPYCNFVEDAGVTCITDQSTVYTTDASGYTIKLGAYSHQDVGKLFEHAKTLFMNHGLPEPRTFRAGGWTATLDTVAALSEHGFVADTSALNWARIEEWKGKELYRWCMENWNPIGDTSQPYYPSQTDVLTSGTTNLPILEIPDNGVMIDYVSLQEMNGIFDANWNGTDVLDTPRTLMMGFHPAMGFSQAEYDRVNHFLEYSDMHLASKHKGPVVYITMSDIVAAFP